MKKPKRFYPEEFELKEDRRRAPVITEEIKEIRERAPIIEDRDPEEFEYNLKMKKGGKVKMHKMPGGKIMKDSDMKKKNLGGLIGLGADKLLKNSEGVRSFTKNLGLGGKLLGSYYDKKKDVTVLGNTSAKPLGDLQTKQVTAKQMGGMVRGGRAEIKGTRPAKLT